MKPAGVALALVATTAASVTALASHHPKRLASASELAPVIPLSPRASRSHEREPLPGLARKPRRHRRPHLAVVGTYADVTEYCATGSRNADGLWPEFGDVAVMDRSIPFGTRVVIDGNVYTVRDWIGSGSDFDIYGGGVGCEQRALNFGRRRLRVVVGR